MLGYYSEVSWIRGDSIPPQTLCKAALKGWLSVRMSVLLVRFGSGRQVECSVRSSFLIFLDMQTNLYHLVRVWQRLSIHVPLALNRAHFGEPSSLVDAKIVGSNKVDNVWPDPDRQTPFTAVGNEQYSKKQVKKVLT